MLSDTPQFIRRTVSGGTNERSGVSRGEAAALLVWFLFHSHQRQQMNDSLAESISLFLTGRIDEMP